MLLLTHSIPFVRRVLEDCETRSAGLWRGHPPSLEVNSTSRLVSLPCLLGFLQRCFQPPWLCVLRQPRRARGASSGFSGDTWSGKGVTFSLKSLFHPQGPDGLSPLEPAPVKGAFQGIRTPSTPPVTCVKLQKGTTSPSSQVVAERARLAAEERGVMVPILSVQDQQKGGKDKSWESDLYFGATEIRL